jgi:four helix bundle protein
MNEDELKERLRQFALRIIRLVRQLPKTVEGRCIAGQLMRAGTSVGANYRAACRARSRADFVAKLAIAEEEADESAYWLDLIMASGLMDRARVGPLHAEALEITAILTASRKSASRGGAGLKSKIQNPKSKIEPPGSGP